MKKQSDARQMFAHMLIMLIERFVALVSLVERFGIGKEVLFWTAD